MSMFRKKDGSKKAGKGRKKRSSASLNKVMHRRTRFLMAVCGMAAFIALGVRLFQLQILEHDTYETAAMEQQLRQTAVSAKRGTIYDRNMNILAMSASVSNIYISPAEIQMNKENAGYIAQGLADILGLEYDEIYQKTLNTDSWYSVVARKVEDDVAEQVRIFKENEGRDAQGNPVTDPKKQVSLTGVKIEQASRRYYPYGSMACHVIGFVGSDESGLSGVELYYNDELSGTDGRIVRAANANGSDLLFTDYEDYYDAVDGKSIVLTIDETVQHYLESHLEQAAEDYMLRGGAAGIVMDVDTGAVLGMASLGNFDLNNYLDISEEAQGRVLQGVTPEEREQLLASERALQWRNKALSDTYEPGSVFKIITLAAGLDSGAVNMNSAFYCGGSIDVLGRDVPLNCWATYGHGDEDLTHAAMNSCNVAFVTIGQKIGAERFYDYIRAFGLFDPTDLDLVGESGSLWWDEDTFFDRSNLSQLAAASFGQTFTITPMQLITAVSAVANGGYLMKPYLVQEILDADGNTVSTTEPTVVRQVISEETSRQACEILEQVVSGDGATGKNAYVPGYRVCGKTGTSEDVVYEAQYGTKKYITSFLGFAPAEDPKVAVLVLLEDPDPSCGYAVSGGAMAAPTVGSILGDVLPYMGVQPEYAAGEEAIVDQRVPRVTGKTVTEAAEALTEDGFTYRIEGDGPEVTAQLPAANATVAAGSEVVLYCGTEPDMTPVEMIDLTYFDYESARVRLGWLGLYVKGTGAMVKNGTVRVMRQSVAAGELVVPGTVITVTMADSSIGSVART